MTEYIFDILGIGGREDSYTDLIAYSFETSHDFRKNMLRILSIPDNGNWIVKTRLPVAVQSNTGRKKDIPDLLLINKDSNSVVLIENKIFSDEGWEQTKRYASNEFRSSLVHYLNENGMIYSKEPGIYFFYLTLEGEKPASDTFKVLKYADISKCIPSNLGDSKRDVLLLELKERIDEYYNWKTPEDDDVLIKYLNGARRLVSPHKAFHTMAEQLQISDEFKKECYITGNRGSSYIPSYQWYKNPGWRGTSCKENNSGSSCFEININFQWDTRFDLFNLYIEYTTRPYQTLKELSTYDEKFLNDYWQARNCFFEHMKSNDIGKWEIKKTPLRIAKVNFDKDITFGELKQSIGELTLNATSIIDEWLQLRHKDCM